MTVSRGRRWGRGRLELPNISFKICSTRPELWAPGGPVELRRCSNVEGGLSNNCRTKTMRGEKRPQFDQHSRFAALFAPCGPNLAIVWLNLVDLCNNVLVDVGQIWGQNLTEFGQIRQPSTNKWPASTNCRQLGSGVSKFGAHRARCGPKRPTLVGIGRNLGSGGNRPTVDGQLFGNFARLPSSIGSQGEVDRDMWRAVVTSFSGNLMASAAIGVSGHAAIITMYRRAGGVVRRRASTGNFFHNTCPRNRFLEWALP